MDLRRLPSVDSLAGDLSDTGLPHALRVDVARAAIELARLQGADPRVEAAEAAAALARSRPARVVNATGVLLHTNLGRAPLHPEAARAGREAAERYANLEISLDSGRRGGRGEYARRLLMSLTGAEDALVVNNNAASLLLTLMALAAGRSVPVSRGELIEIGGSYRLPEIMSASGAHLTEVGTTNRTRPADYRRAVEEGDPALLLKVHPSNYRIDGFTQDVGIAGLAGLAREAELPLVYDVGSGLLDAGVPWLPGPPPAWLHDEPGVRQALEAGADLVLFSGDKLLGGPQAGLVVGRHHLVERLRRHPAARAMRVDGSTLAGLAVTLELYASGRGAEIPFWTMAAQTYASLEERADRVLDQSGVDGVVRPGSSAPGAGSVPTMQIPTPVISVSSGGDRGYLELLRCQPPILARREAGELLVDLRTVEPEQDRHVSESLARTCRS